MSNKQPTDEEIWREHYDALGHQAAEDRKVPIAHDEPYRRLFNDRRHPQEMDRNGTIPGAGWES